MIRTTIVLAFALSAAARAVSTAPSGYLRLDVFHEIQTARGMVLVSELREGDVVRFREAERGRVEATVSRVTRGRVAHPEVPRLALDHDPLAAGFGDDWLWYNANIVLPATAIAGMVAPGPFLLAMGCTAALANTPPLWRATRSWWGSLTREKTVVWLTDVRALATAGGIQIIL